jgi:hypothetical protein
MLADFSASVFCRIGGSAQACQAEYAGSIRVIGSNGIFQEIGRPDPKTGRSLAAAPQPPSLPGNPFALVPPIAPGSPSSQQQHRTRDEFGPLATWTSATSPCLRRLMAFGIKGRIRMLSRWIRAGSPRAGCLSRPTILSAKDDRRVPKLLAILKQHRHSPPLGLHP